MPFYKRHFNAIQSSTHESTNKICEKSEQSGTTPYLEITQIPNFLVVLKLDKIQSILSGSALDEI